MTPIRALETAVLLARARRAARGRNKFVGRLGKGVEVRVIWVDAIERTPGGKSRPFIRRCG